MATAPCGSLLVPSTLVSGITTNSRAAVSWATVMGPPSRETGTRESLMGVACSRGLTVRRNTGNTKGRKVHIRLKVGAIRKLWYTARSRFVECPFGGATRPYSGNLPCVGYISHGPGSSYYLVVVYFGPETDTRENVWSPTRVAFFANDEQLRLPMEMKDLEVTAFQTWELVTRHTRWYLLYKPSSYSWSNRSQVPTKVVSGAVDFPSGKQISPRSLARGVSLTKFYVACSTVD